MFALLVAYVQGRGGVLDDRGVVIDSEMHGEWDPDAQNPYDYDEDPANVADTIVTESRLRRLFTACWGIGSVSISLLSVLVGIYFVWRISGWLGHSLFGVSGALGNIVGLVAGVIVFLGCIFLSSRLQDARRAVRAGCGQRNLNDCIDIFDLVDLSDRCGACAFLIRDLAPNEDDGYVQCPECGAVWDRVLWVGFLKTDRVGVLMNLRMKQRRRSCQYDGRGQMMRVMASRDGDGRDEQIKSCRARMAIWDVFLFMIILLFLGGACVGVVYFALFTVADIGGLIAASIAAGLLLIVTIVAVMALNHGVWVRRVKQFIRDQIDDRVCPSCEESLGDEPHPVDGALVCEGCGLAWDPATKRRGHHSRKRVPDERYKADPVFVEIPA